MKQTSAVLRQAIRLLGLSAVVMLTARPDCFAGTKKYWENGNFLIPRPKDGTFALVNTGERYGVWRVIGAPGSVSWVSGTYTHDGFSFPAEGKTPEKQTDPWVNLASVTMSATGIMHGPVPTKVGEKYRLSFFVGNLVDPHGIYGTTSTVLVYANATLLGSYTNSDGAGTTVENWKHFAVTFKADYPYTTIAFVNGDPVGDMNCGVSNTDLFPLQSER